jgi:hypothetical protein
MVISTKISAKAFINTHIIVASFKALEGYCWFHRWFLEFATTNMDVRQAVDVRITNFVNSEQFRTKKATPSLGEWICLLSVSDRYNWTNVSAAYINESK